MTHRRGRHQVSKGSWPWSSANASFLDRSFSILFAPDCHQVSVEDGLHHARVKYVEGIFLARPRSFTVRVPALRKRPSLSQRCLSVVELVRISWISGGITGKVSMSSSTSETTEKQHGTHS